MCSANVVAAHTVRLLRAGIVFLMTAHRSTNMTARPLKSRRSLLGITIQQHRNDSGLNVATGIC